MTDLFCRNERRRQWIRGTPPHNGIDYVDVEGKHLCVHFLTGIPEVFLVESNDDKERALGHIVIKGGRRVRNLHAVSFDAHATDDTFDEDCLGIELDREGDWSQYTLCFVELDEKGRPTETPLRALDPRYACISFSFKLDCPAEIDCKPSDEYPPPKPAPRDTNYLAKDYLTFRQLMLDRLSLVMPDWRERHVPDTGIAVVEVLAYTADYLSYYQDAVATEAYLDTARQRISVRRHARLVDYAMHEGCNARVFVALRAAADEDLDAPFDFYFITRPPGADAPAHMLEADLAHLPLGWVPFEPLAPRPIRMRRAHNTIGIYTWGDQECCLAKGATRATLVGPLDLLVGDYLLFEELACAGTVTGELENRDRPQPDADATHRHVVRLTAVHESYDPLEPNLQLVEVEWSDDDALPFTLCVSAIGAPDDCRFVDGLAVARGNIVLADHGLTIRDEELGPVPDRTPDPLCEDEEELADVARVAGRYRPKLATAPLTFAQPLGDGTPATLALRQDPRKALPAIGVSSIPPSFDGIHSWFTAADLADPRALAASLADPKTPAMISLRNRLQKDVWKDVDALIRNLRKLLEAWSARGDLLDSDRDEAVFVAEIDDDGRAHLRFGDGAHGRAVETGATFLATYRSGNGRAGLVGAEAIGCVVFRKKDVVDAIDGVRNPMPAAGAIDPEPVADVKLFAPSAFRATLQRAVIAPDYARLARTPELQSAAATLRWTGSWYEADVALDPLHTEALEERLQSSVTATLQRYRRMGHDLRVGPARYIPLYVEIEICVAPRYLRAHVVAAVRETLRRFFDPDNLTFGATVHASRVVAAVQAVDGVSEVHVRRLERLDARTVNLPAATSPALVLRPTEVVRLDNDPIYPENGILRIEARGGR